MKIQRISGIQKKYLINIVLLLALALLLSSVGVGVYVRKNISNVVLDKYEFMTEKMGITLDGLYKKSEEVTAECITDKNVQRSLQAAELELGEKNALSKYFAYTDLDYVSEYCYIDNKENVYTKSYSNLSYKDFKKSGIEKKLSSNYAKTQWFFQEDTLFQTGRSELFIGRNVRNMEDAHAPGMLFFKMDEKYLESIVEEQNGIEDIVVGVVDDKGNLCMQYTPESFALNEQDEEKITGLFKYKGAGMILERERLRSGMLQAYRQQESGFTIFTLVPNTVLNRGMTEIALVLLVIYLVVIIIAMEVSFYISKIFTKPILMLSKEMEQFDGKDFSHTVKIETNTELDKIGNSYNEMLQNIENLLNEIKKQEKELRTSELNMLINQIKPHFLYNTLDTIYMLARINGEKTYLDNYRQIWDLYINNATCKPTEISTKTADDATAEFVTEEAVFYQNGTWEYNNVVDLGDENLGMLPIYIGVEGEEEQGVCTGTENYWCVNAKASEEDIQATLDFMNWCVTSETGVESMCKDMGFVIPFDANLKSENVLVNEANKYLDEGKTPVSWNFSTMPSEEWKNGVGSALTAYAADQTDANWDKVVTAFVDGWATEAAAAK